MAVIVSIIDSCKNYWFPGDVATACTEVKEPQELLLESLGDVAGGLITEKQCLDNCRPSLSAAVEKLDCGLSLESQQELAAQYKKLDSAVDGTIGLSQKSRTLLHSLLKASYLELVEKKWAGGMAASFHSASTLVDEEQRLKAVMGWLDKLFAGMEFTRSFADGMASEEYVKAQLELLKEAFTEHDSKVVQMKLRNALLKREKGVGEVELFCYHPQVGRGANLLERVVLNEFWLRKGPSLDASERCKAVRIAFEKR